MAVTQEDGLRLGKGPELCWSLDDEGRSHPAKMECRVVPKGRVGSEVRKVRGRMCWAGARARARARDKVSDIQGQIILLLVITVDIY